MTSRSQKSPKKNSGQASNMAAKVSRTDKKLVTKRRRFQMDSLSNFPDGQMEVQYIRRSNHTQPEDN